MKTKKIIIPVAIILVLLVGIGLSIGLTYSLWSDTAGGDTSVAPSITTYDWNDHIKDFTYTAYNSNGSIIKSDIHNGDTLTQMVSYFSCTGLTDNLLREEIVFPTTISYVYNSTAYSAPVTEIGNTLFNGVTDKSRPTKLFISPSITKVKQVAFIGLTGLQSVTICASSSTDTHGVRFGYQAFGSCSALKEIKCDGQLSIVFTDLTFEGCTSLITLDKGTCNLFYIQNINSTSSTTPITSSNWATYKTTIFPGTPSGLNPFN